MEKLKKAIIAHLELLTVEELKIIYQLIRHMVRK